MISRFAGRAALSLALVGVVALAGCAPLSDPRPSKPTVERADRASELRRRFLDSNGPAMVVAHRGCWTTTAENSLAAIAACRRLGVDMVELDVQRTRDGRLMLMHDATVDRTTNGSGRVADLTLAQIKALRLKVGAGGPTAALTDEAPPTFSEAMEAARGAILVNVDAKGEVNLQAVQELERMGLVDQVVIKSPAPADDPELRAVLDGRNLLLFMPILRERDGTVLSTAPDRYRPQPPAYEVVFTTEAYLEAGAPLLRARSGRVWVNTLEPAHAAGHVDEEALRDPDAHWGRLIRMGANIIQTDEPGALIDWLKMCGCTPEG
ncbi:MAG: glycerophosphodiester phosphodiesterase family protein [Alphaproteobacteria bacterium]|jgi:glycerophosphoryl diester phosphodiesterase|uniref:glycerophosphodiester phosphodiesterase family protein n=1 Tax=Brevundimonas sp. TaxID=1871086 RepID=UPI001DB574DE|nr:glycerophosphodiester phosphodiesterase family protein [Alphaproteobacteria bacterium]MBU1522875.1 glycerophosphodiester phosphodiesterase family protein [Alphaproteobacteria bacterium]MBU2030565.1 glycerophosphodiester phosphodiesterase family protein [Alphaproteobacteria bacterium]MBU2166196.1 glycerophosphodiester phosphodiesterase family protein [Alphaproteobacteria bacterium]MBU2232400.1 glycerophosphodiester phosphodiesterase family protein [Alphaproteobacteria bacterium]